MSNQSSIKPSLLVCAGQSERQYVLGLSDVTLGRSRQCDVVLEEPSASRKHARIFAADDEMLIQDLGSRNGTYLNGQRLPDQAQPLKDADQVTIGKTVVHYLAPSAEEASIATMAGPMPLDTLANAMLAGNLGATLAGGSTASLGSSTADDSLMRIMLLPSDAPRIVAYEHGETTEVDLRDESLTVGRDPNCDLRVFDESTSRRHAIVEPFEKGHRVRDLGSRNGIKINGIACGEHLLSEGDVVRIGSAQLIYKSGSRSPVVSDGTPRRPVVLVPGFAGSELWSQGERLWPNLRKLLRLSDPSVYWGEVEVGQVVRDVSIVPGLFKMESFGSILDFMCRELGYTSGEDLLEFAYDWRQDVRQSSRDLAAAVKQWRSQRPNPTERVTIVAHSMGGLVSRYFLHHLRGSEAVERAVFLGTPHKGSTSALALALAGRGVLPFNLPMNTVKKVVTGFPSLYQLLPVYDAGILENGREFMPLGDDGWLPEQHRAHLELAASFRRELEQDAGRLPVPLTSIFGYGQNTLARLKLDCDAAGMLTLGEQLFETTGDAAVLETSAVLDGSDIHPVCQQHGALYVDRDVQRRLRFELLDRP